MKEVGKRLASLALALILLLAVLPGSVLAADLKVNSISADKPSAAVGQKITWTATASGGTGSYRYCFYVFKDNKILERGSYGTANTYSYTPTAGGSYTVRVYVKDSANTAVNKMSTPITVSAAPINVTLTVNRTKVELNEKITWTATASGGTGSYKYCFYLFKDGKIKQRGSYGAAKTKAYTPTEAGTYTVRVYVKDSAGTVKTQEGGKCIASAPIEVISFEPMFGTVNEGLSETWTVEAGGGLGTLQYCFYLYRYHQTQGTWKIVQRGTYSTDSTFEATLNIPGRYLARVYIKDSAGTTAVVDCSTTTECITAYLEPIQIISVEPDRTVLANGQWVTWTATVTGGYPPLQYSFYLYVNGEIRQRGLWSNDNTFSTEVWDGESYLVRVYVKDLLPETVPQSKEAKTISCNVP